EVNRDGFAELAMLFEELLEVHAADKLHHHEILPADLAKVEGLDDAGMDEVRDQPSLTDEVVLKLLDRRILLTNELYCDNLAKVAGAKLLSFVNDAHAAVGNLAHHFIVELVENVFDRRHWGLRKGVA